MRENHRATINIITTPTNINVDWNYAILWEVNKSGKVKCYIPGIDIYFVCTTESDILQKAKTLCVAYVDYFLMEKSKYGLRNLVLDLNARGFKTNSHQLVMKNFAQLNPVSSKFKSNDSAVMPPFDFNKVINANGSQQLVLH